MPVLQGAQPQDAHGITKPGNSLSVRSSRTEQLIHVVDSLHGIPRRAKKVNKSYVRTGLDAKDRWGVSGYEPPPHNECPICQGRTHTKLPRKTPVEGQPWLVTDPWSGPQRWED